MSYAMTSRQKRHLLHQHIAHLHACKHLKMLKKMAIKGSSSDEEEEDARSSSNDEKEPMNPYLYKQVKKMNKYLKEINSLGVYGLSQRWVSPSTHEG